MKKRNIIILLSVLSLITILIVGYFILKNYLINHPIGPGTAYETNVVKGCDIIRNSTTGNFEQLTDEDKSNIRIEYGYGVYGLKQTSLKDFCSPEGKYKDTYDVCSPGFMSWLLGSCAKNK